MYQGTTVWRVSRPLVASYHRPALPVHAQARLTVILTSGVSESGLFSSTLAGFRSLQFQECCTQ